MNQDVSATSSIRDETGLRDRVARWVLLTGDRRVVAAGIVIGFSLVTFALVTGGVLAIGPGSTVSTLFASGLTSGAITLLTIALSINQLILSRVFGSPNELRGRLDATRDLRTQVETLADRPSSPNDPSAFLSLLGKTLAKRTTELLGAIDRSEWDAPPPVAATIQTVGEYGRNIAEHLDRGDEIVGVLELIIGPEYAQNIVAIHHHRNANADSISEAVDAEFQATEDVLEAIAIVRQFFKTIALQQDFAHLSRLVVYLGLTALVVSMSLALIYRPDSVTVPLSVLPVVVSLGVGVVVSPLAIFVAYIFRAATIAYDTISVGPFIPPQGRA
ncbi:hypothetical protein [Halorarius litoreus]|uniref:hypothetical protein n=1 Tax=Halorarius litoreus TaxID=2962676 RepID=UPI0020CEC9EA|nr:hypothetical protein [Halorarius litoreus]